MRKKWMQAVLTVVGIAALSSVAAHAQTDVGLSFYKTFNTSTTGNGTTQSPSNSAGGMLEVRHIHSPFIGYEATYSYNPNDQMLSPTTGNCGYRCTNQPTKITTRASEIALDWVVSTKFAGLRPFAVAGVGFYIGSPTSNQYDLNTIVRPAYVFGGGVDWGFLPHFGLRAQFRDNMFKAPDLDGLYSPTGVYTHMAEPMIGVFYTH